MITLHGTDGISYELSLSDLCSVEKSSLAPGSVCYTKIFGYIFVCESVSQVKKKYRDEMHSLKNLQEEIPFNK